MRPLIGEGASGSVRGSGSNPRSYSTIFTKRKESVFSSITRYVYGFEPHALHHKQKPGLSTALVFCLIMGGQKYVGYNMDAAMAQQPDI